MHRQSRSEPQAYAYDPASVHIDAASIGIARTTPSQEGNRSAASASPLKSSHLSKYREAARRNGARSFSLTEDPDEEASERPESRHQLPPYTSTDQHASVAPHATVRVSKHTHSAILYALEQALRYPNQFTPDVAEESASMADLSGGGVTTAPLPVPRPAPAPTSSPSGIRSPRIIMQERAAREARKKAEEEEQQRLEQQQMAEESRILEAARRRNAERRAGAAVGPDAAAHTRQQSLEQAPPLTAHRIPTSQTNPNTATAAASQRVAQNPAQQQTPSQAYLGQGNAAQRRSQERQQAATAGAAAPPPSDPVKPRNSFPHAFERWETLSAHWEGLTSYWIRKLEQNKDEVNRDPMNQQLARQVTDLSAAGANLFHAVVELQRLRASSERKFQRWFFETRTELEQAQEVKAVLEAALEKEKRDRDSAVREAVDNDQGSSKMQKQMAEMRKELAISKEEARRAWEELGRREQEERDRTLSLQSGQPTLVGGVQVVPMTHSGHARQSSSRDHGASYEPDYSYGQAREGREGREHERSTTPTGHRTPENRGYSSQHRQTDDGVSPPSATATSDGHYGEVAYIRDNQGNYLLDNQGNRIPYHTATSSHSGSDRQEYETPSTTNPPSGSREAPAASSPRAQWTVPTSSFSAAAGPSGTNKPAAAQQPSQQAQKPAQKQQHAPQQLPPQQQQQQQQQADADIDYSGEGYGEASWETRHHHPTRLSDVMEEDERSRTSASHRGA